MKVVDILRHPLLKGCYDLMGEIEKIPASPEQTNAIVKASEFMKAIDETFTQTKFVWMLEDASENAGGPVYWTQNEQVNHCWTIDPNKGVHFSDKRSAELVATTIEGTWVAREHGFG